MRVVILGGGLIGYSIALHLAAKASEVTIVDPAMPGLASRAAAGMLTPECEWDPWMPRAFLDLLRTGKAYYSDFISRVLGLSETDHGQIGFARRSFLILNLQEAKSDFSHRIAYMTETSAAITPLARADICRHESGINPTAHDGGILVQDEAVVNPRLLLQAMKNLAADRGIRQLKSRVTRAVRKADGVTVVLDTGATIDADRLVLAAGAWSMEAARDLGFTLPITPVKGQIVELSGPPDLIGNVIFMPTGGCGSILQRAPGVYIVGTSEEFCETTTRNSPLVIASILSRLNRVLLPARDLSIEDMWSGFRPMAPDELPVLGFLSDGVTAVATGHHRNGVLLAPITGRLVSDLLFDRDPGVDLTPYLAHRNFKSQHRHVARY